MKKKNALQYADDDYETIGTLFRLRAPSLFLGLILGIGISFVTSNFEKVLSENIKVAFFMPFIVYIAAAVGTQTEAIYSGDLKTGNAQFKNYFHKELALGLIFGIVFASFSGGIALVWLHDKLLALSVSLASFLAIATAPIVALLVAQTFQSIHKDPAVGTGPIATVLQDIISIVIYGIVASQIILS